LNRVRCVFNSTMFVGTCIYLLVGFVGYAHAGEYTCGNILLNFSPDDKVMGVARGALSISMLCTYPLILLPCRNSFSRLLSFCGMLPRPVETEDRLLENAQPPGGGCSRCSPASS